MARPREFVESDAIDAARDAFWRKGYAGTSISDLSEATGLSVGSIYKAFGSKSNLCHRTLESYVDTGLTWLDEMLASGETPLEGIENWLETMSTAAAADVSTRGCYVVVSAIELSETDPAALREIRRYDDGRRSRVAGALRAANSAGQLDCDPVIGARLLCTTIDGIQVEARKGISAADARATLRLALHALQ